MEGIACVTSARHEAYEDAMAEHYPGLASLRREHRAVLFVSVVDGHTQREIAAMLGVPTGTVASWLSRAKVAMRKALADG